MYNEDNYNCLLLIVFFVVASSIGGIVSSIGGTMLGLPFEWSYLIELPILAVGFLLIYRRYPPTAWILAVCVGIIILFAVAILHSLTVRQPALPEKLAAVMDERNLNLSDYESNGFSLFGLDDIYNTYNMFLDDRIINVDEDIAFMNVSYAPESNVTLTIIFPTIQTSGGLWAFESGQVRVSGAMNGAFQARDTDNWINADSVDFDTSAADPLRNVEPYLVISLPMAVHQNESITLDATLNITYPEGDEVKSETLTRQVEAFVLPENIYIFENRYNNWKRAHHVTHSSLWIFLVIGSVISGGIGLMMVRMGALQYRGSGSMIFEVRRISGLRKLGVEAHPLATMHISDQKGIFIGLVHAQSPAGRGGIRSGDILVQFGGKQVNSPGELNRMAGRLKKGESVQVSLLRNDAPVDVVVKF